MTDELRTDRLLLRQWRDADLDPWAAMNADPQVREFLGELLTRGQSRQSMARFRADLDERGWGWWAVEVVATGAFIGSPAGPGRRGHALQRRGDRLAAVPRDWGHGYATEAARAVLAYGFDKLGPAGDPGDRGRPERAVACGDAPARHDLRPGGRLRGS